MPAESDCMDVTTCNANLNHMNGCMLAYCLLKKTAQTSMIKCRVHLRLSVCLRLRTEVQVSRGKLSSHRNSTQIKIVKISLLGMCLNLKENARRIAHTFFECNQQRLHTLFYSGDGLSSCQQSVSITDVSLDILGTMASAGHLVLSQTNPCLEVMDVQCVQMCVKKVTRHDMMCYV